MPRLIFVILLLISSSTFAEKVGKSAFNKLAEDSDWTCKSETQVKLLESSNRKLKEVLSICLYNAKCKKNTQPKDAPKEELNFVVTCKLDGEQCLDLKECSEKQQQYEEGEIKWNDGISKGEAIPDNKKVFGPKCEYDGSAKVLLRQYLKWPEYLDPLCATPIKNCTLPKGKEHEFVAACKAIDRVSEKKDGKDVFTMVCPPAQDCLAKAIPVTKALTVSEAKDLTSNAARPTNTSGIITTAGTGVAATIVANSKPAHSTTTGPEKK